jgi:hypothetical protein
VGRNGGAALSESIGALIPSFVPEIVGAKRKNNLPRSKRFFGELVIKKFQNHDNDSKNLKGKGIREECIAQNVAKNLVKMKFFVRNAGIKQDFCGYSFEVRNSFKF